MLLAVTGLGLCVFCIFWVYFVSRVAGQPFYSAIGGNRPVVAKLDPMWSAENIVISYFPILPKNRFPGIKPFQLGLIKASQRVARVVNCGIVSSRSIWSDDIWGCPVFGRALSELRSFRRLFVGNIVGVSTQRTEPDAKCEGLSGIG